MEDEEEKKRGAKPAGAPYGYRGLFRSRSFPLNRDEEKRGDPKGLKKGGLGMGTCLEQDICL